MHIDFDQSRWEQLRNTYRAWWAGQLERPLIPVVLPNRDPGRPEPEAPLLTQATCADLDIPADRLIDRIDYELSKNTYFGDAYPSFCLSCFGPGIAGAFMGATLDNRTGSVWFFPPADMEIEDLHFQFDPDNIWFRRISDIYAAGMKRWQGQVLMGMADLGGSLDILSTFRPGEKLLLDLYDHPEEVKQALWEAHEAWHRYYDALNDVLQPLNPGYSNWSGIYSEAPGYMLQCDFCYMIGPGMFDEFVKPELAATCGRLPHAFYHLDGPGQIPHLESLLTIPELNGVQWVPGAGQPGCGHWPEVYEKINAAGKLIQLIDGFDALDAISARLGSARGIHLLGAGGEDEAGIRKKLEEYGIV